MVGTTGEGAEGWWWVQSVGLSGSRKAGGGMEVLYILFSGVCLRH